MTAGPICRKRPVLNATGDAGERLEKLKNKKCVALLSGGLDSFTAAAMMKAEGFDIYALTMSYGQRHAVEMDAARRAASFLGVRRHVFMETGLGTLGGSALTAGINVPKDRDESQMSEEIPVTYVPARNTVFLSCALAFAEVLGTGDIVIGANAVDYSGYPDCRPEFIAAFEYMANLAVKAAVTGETRVRIHAPLLSLTKAEIIGKGLALGLDYSITHSCYDPSPDGRACGRCDSCIIRARGFEQAGIADPSSPVA